MIDMAHVSRIEDARHGIRRRALVGLGVSVLLAVPLVGFMVWAASRGMQFYGIGIGAPLLPVIYFLTELVSGQRFGRLARAWDGLAGVQRFLLGVAILAMAVAVFAIIGATIGLLASGDFGRWMDSF